MSIKKRILTDNIQKHDIEFNWLKAVNFIPDKGMLIVYDRESDDNGNLLEGVTLPQGRTIGFNFERIKIGDGITNVNDLPFANGVGEATSEGGEIFNTYEDKEFDVSDTPHYNSNVLNNVSGGTNGKITQNKAISEGTTAIGSSNVAGTKAFTILEYCEDGGTVNGKTSPDGSKSGYFLVKSMMDTAVLSNKIGNMYSVWLFNSTGANNRYERIEGNISLTDTDGKLKIRVTHFRGLSSGNPFVPGKSYIRLYDDTYQPLVDLGDTSIEGWSTATGLNNKAVGMASFATGKFNTTDGAYSFVSGQHNTVGRNSLGAGQKNQVDSFGAVFGQENKVTGAHGFSTGHGNQVRSDSGVAMGANVVSINEFESVFGSYNDPYVHSNLTKGIPQATGGVSIDYNSKTVKWTFVNNGTPNRRHFVLNETFESDKSYSLKLKFKNIPESGVEVDFYLCNNPDPVKATSKSKLEGKSITVTNNTQIYTLTFDKPVYNYLSIRPKETLTSGGLELVDVWFTSEYNKDILHAIGNGTSANDRKNAFTVYKDGHAEVDSMGESDKSIATKEYVDKEIKNTNLVQVVNSLPEEGLPNQIYLVPSLEKFDNAYEEYVWVSTNDNLRIFQGDLVGTINSSHINNEWVDTVEWISLDNNFTPYRDYAPIDNRDNLYTYIEPFGGASAGLMLSDGTYYYSVYACSDQGGDIWAYIKNNKLYVSYDGVNILSYDVAENTKIIGVSCQGEGFANNQITIYKCVVMTDGWESIGLRHDDLVDYATKDYVDEEIAKINFIKIVSELPEEGLPNNIYLIPKDGEEKIIYEGYGYVDGNENSELFTFNGLSKCLITTKELVHPMGALCLLTSDNILHTISHGAESGWIPYYECSIEGTTLTINRKWHDGYWEEDRNDGVATFEVAEGSLIVGVGTGGHYGIVDEGNNFIISYGELEPNNLFDEYIWTEENKWEFIGMKQAKIDLDNYVTHPYLEINYATKDYVDTEIAAFDFIKVVNQLPRVGLINRIYFVPKTAEDSEQENDLFDEYVWINIGTEAAPVYDWEWITTKQMEIDLSGYVKKESGKGLSTNDFTNAYKTKLDSIVTNDTPKTIDGDVSGEVITIRDVHPVEHEVEVKLSSKNLLDFTTAEPYKSSTIEFLENGLIYNGNWYITFYVSGLEVGETYHFTCDYETTSPATGALWRYVYTDGTSSGTAYISQGRKAEKEVERIFFYPEMAATVYTSTLTNIQLEKGTTATAYTPYLADTSTVGVKRYGKNLFSPYLILPKNENGKYIKTQFGVTVEYLPDEDCFLFNGTMNKTTAQNVAQVNYNMLGNVGAKYTVSTRYISGELIKGTSSNPLVYLNEGYDTTNTTTTNWINIALDNQDRLSAPTYQNHKVLSRNYIRSVRFYMYPNDTFNNYKVRIQLEESAVATEYESFKQPVDVVDGTVKSISPNMTLISDNAGAIITAKYNKDINKTINIIPSNNEDRQIATIGDISNSELITIEDIDTICGSTISYVDLSEGEF